MDRQSSHTFNGSWCNHQTDSNQQTFRIAFPFNNIFRFLNFLVLMETYLIVLMITRRHTVLIHRIHAICSQPILTQNSYNLQPAYFWHIEFMQSAAGLCCNIQNSHCLCRVVLMCKILLQFWHTEFMLSAAELFWQSWFDAQDWSNWLDFCMLDRYIKYPLLVYVLIWVSLVYNLFGTL